MLELTFKEIKPFLRANLQTGKQAPALLGKPGIGKSSLLKDLAREYNTKTFMLQVNQLGDKTDLTGIQSKQLDSGDLTQVTYPHTTIKQAMDYANEHPDKIVILGLDEINRTSSDITSACLSLVTERTIGQDKLPDNIRIVITGNDEGNIITLDEASLTRFHLYKVKPDVDTFFKVTEQLHPLIERLLKNQPKLLTAPHIDEQSDNPEDDNIFATLDTETMNQTTNPRTITALNDLLLALGLDGSNTLDELMVYRQVLNHASGDTPLYKAMIATTGHTRFTLELYDLLFKDYEDKIERQDQLEAKQLTESIQPSDEIIQMLSKAASKTDIDQLLTQLSEQDEANLLLWLLDISNIKQLNNTDAAMYIIKELRLPQTPPEHINHIMLELVKNKSQLFDRSVETLLERNDPFVDYYRGLLTY